MSKTQQAADLLDEFLDDSAAIEEVEGAAIAGQDLSAALAEWCEANGRDVPTPQSVGRALASLGFEREKVGGEFCRIGLRLAPVNVSDRNLEESLLDYRIDADDPQPPQHLSLRASDFFRWVVARAAGLTVPQLAFLVSGLEHWDLSQSFRRRLQVCLEGKPDAERDQKVLHQMMVTHSRDFVSIISALGLDGHEP